MTKLKIILLETRNYLFFLNEKTQIVEASMGLNNITSHHIYLLIHSRWGSWKIKILMKLKKMVKIWKLKIFILTDFSNIAKVLDIIVLSWWLIAILAWMILGLKHVHVYSARGESKESDKNRYFNRFCENVNLVINWFLWPTDEIFLLVNIFL